jgi:hypothetical protein
VLSPILKLANVLYTFRGREGALTVVLAILERAYVLPAIRECARALTFEFSVLYAANVCSSIRECECALTVRKKVTPLPNNFDAIWARKCSPTSRLSGSILTDVRPTVGMSMASLAVRLAVFELADKAQGTGQYFGAPAFMPPYVRISWTGRQFAFSASNPDESDTTKKNAYPKDCSDKAKDRKHFKSLV